MEFRPCIDIHNGKVKQIVGGSLKDRGDFANENFVSEQDSRFYADMYRMQSSWYENHGSERECDEENRKYI